MICIQKLGEDNTLSTKNIMFSQEQQHITLEVFQKWINKCCLKFSLVNSHTNTIYMKNHIMTPTLMTSLSCLSHCYEMSFTRSFIKWHVVVYIYISMLYFSQNTIIFQAYPMLMTQGKLGAQVQCQLIYPITMLYR